MSRYWDDNKTYSQPAISTLKKNAVDTKRKEKAKGKTLEPVVATGNTIIQSWWGKAWCDNLERYADYESRLDRGQRYVRSGTVVDLKIQKGKITARVQGSRKTPYRVEIRISPLSEERCQEIIGRCGRQIENMETLIEGNFPQEMQDIFLGERGLFPTPNEISLNCSCPDWALLCKHVAAALYGIGVRLDEDPLLFFKLRGIDVERFIDVTLASKVDSMLANVNCTSKRIIMPEDADPMFGIFN